MWVIKQSIKVEFKELPTELLVLEVKRQMISCTNNGAKIDSAAVKPNNQPKTPFSSDLQRYCRGKVGMMFRERSRGLLKGWGKCGIARSII